MQAVEQHVISKSDPRYAVIDQAAFASKNLYNAALYEMRQTFIFQHVRLTYNEMDKRMKAHPAYKGLPAKVSQQVFCAVGCLIDDFNGASLSTQERFQVAKAKAGKSILVLHHNEGEALIFQECQELGAAIIDARADFLDDFSNVVALGDTIGRQPLCLAIKIGLVRSLRDTGIDSHPCLMFWERRMLFLHQDGMHTNTSAFDLAVPKPAPGCFVTDSLLFGVVT